MFSRFSAISSRGEIKRNILHVVGMLLTWSGAELPDIRRSDKYVNVVKESGSIMKLVTTQKFISCIDSLFFVFWHL